MLLPGDMVVIKDLWRDYLSIVQFHAQSSDEVNAMIPYLMSIGLIIERIRKREGQVKVMWSDGRRLTMNVVNVQKVNIDPTG